ncbi:A-kinase anchor protein 14-like [Lineus longissimus]|uniref:A-kinase anchor protein 14-like n=1 Tax=Lineus longissimus TaxID=88925 RepID=UPI002B4DB0DE
MSQDISETTLPSDAFIQQAHQLVDDVIDGAMKQLEHEVLQRSKTLDTIAFESRESTAIEFEDYDVPNIDWLSIDEFSVEKAEEKINDFIQTWEYEGSWLYCIDYLGVDEHQYDYRHRYRVRWSIPTRRKPIPKATASVYFTFQISKIKPKHYPIDVYYVFETNRLVHRPGQSRFRELWLKNIIESKAIMMLAVDF